MPWNGTGTYTRGYASWTSDATNGLPISATKFDTEDNDFAAGIQNCLTIDNQNKPNATLTWAQTLALTKGTDSTVLSIGRTGGNNSPSLAWSVADAANSITATLNTGNPVWVITSGAYSFGNATDDPSFSFTGKGLISTVGATNTPALTLASGSAQSAYIDFSINGTPKALVGSSGSTGNIIGGDAAGDFGIATTGTGNINFSVNGSTSICAQFNSTTNALKITDNAASSTLWPVGYLGLPQTQQNTNYTTVLSDQAKQICHTSGTAHTFTIAANASVAYPTGTVLHFVNLPGSGILTIAITSDTMTLVPAGSTGSRTLTAPGVATAEKVGPTTWLIYGSNLT